MSSSFTISIRNKIDQRALVFFIDKDKHISYNPIIIPVGIVFFTLFLRKTSLPTEVSFFIRILYVPFGV